jgi:hypothetical protein
MKELADSIFFNIKNLQLKLVQELIPLILAIQKGKSAEISGSLT